MAGAIRHAGQRLRRSLHHGACRTHQCRPDEILDRLRKQAGHIAASAHGIAAEAAIEIDVLNSYPGLDTPAASQAVQFVKSLTGANDTIKVAYGTEGGLFSRDLGTPTVVCGPGSMAQGHRPDEYVTIEQLRRCDAMLSNLLERLKSEWHGEDRPI
jgi:acetylornithine deacetylase